ncbi:NACHT domain-containing protein [Nocardia sp. NPDC002869]|uniref:NACHT N-terminal Helical domain 1-containing protein n=1 Tax=Nocardia sp. NPDC002869 TaxID=3161032 RepID=UPI00398D0340
MAEPLLGSLLAKAIAPIIGEAARQSLVQPKGAGLTSDPIRIDSRIPFRKTKRSLQETDIRSIASTIDRKLDPILKVEYGGIPDNEVSAAVEAVGDALTALTPVTSNTVFDLDLDPDKLYSRALEVSPHLPQTREMISKANDLYHLLLKLCCAQIVEFITTRPEFLNRSAVEQLQRSAQISNSIDSLSSSLLGTTEAVYLEFEKRYYETLQRRLDRLQLFGVTLARESTYPLSTAYMSLCAAAAGSEAVDGTDTEPTSSGSKFSGDRVESMISAANRVVIRGGAGSGKTTLLQWLAVSVSKADDSEELANWSNIVPFFIPLRRFIQKEEFPAPEDFVASSVGLNLTAETPNGWVHAILRAGRGLLLIDGVDEVPESLRTKAREWLRNLVGDFPASRYIVTSRPSAVADDWLAKEEFAVLDLLPMSPSDVRMFIKHWHDAAREEVDTEDKCVELTRYEESLANVVTSERQISRLATNPLLCALLCALYRDRRMQLPRDRMELYNAALEMLLTRRDAEREIIVPGGVALGATQSVRLLQKLAFWLISNGYSDAEKESAVARIGELIQNMPRISTDAQTIYNHLLIRSGLIREPIDGRMDFVHRTFEEFLGAKEAVESESFGLLINNSHEDQWHGVFSMAVGHARPAEQQRLLLALLDRGDREEPSVRTRLHLLAAACLEYVHELDQSVLDRVRSAASALIPPKKFGEAQILATAGDMVLDLLPKSPKLPARTAAAVVRTAALIGGSSALTVIERFKYDTRLAVQSEIVDSFYRFDGPEYAERIFSGLEWPTLREVFIRSDEEKEVLRYVKEVIELQFVGNISFDSIRMPPRAHFLRVYANSRIENLEALIRFSDIEDLAFGGCPNLRTLKGIENFSDLRALRISGADSYSVDFSQGNASMEHLELSLVGISDFHKLAGFSNISSFRLDNCFLDNNFRGIEALPTLRNIYIPGPLFALGVNTREQYREAVRRFGPNWSAISDTMFEGMSEIEIRLGRSIIDSSLSLFEQMNIPDEIIQQSRSEPVLVFFRNSEAAPLSRLLR